MKRRWFIRSLFMLPILLCLIGWGWSAGYLSGVKYQGQGWRVRLAMRGGMIEVEHWRDDFGQRGLHLVNWPGPLCFWPGMGHHLGFGYLYGSYEKHIALPFWFLILVFSGLLWFVWRQTRPKPNGGAFPVEVKANGTA